MNAQIQPEIKEFQSETKQVLRLGDSFALLAQGNLPARTDLECLGCLREAALRGAREALELLGGDNLVDHADGFRTAPPAR
jgi:hypothetical protein